MQDNNHLLALPNGASVDWNLIQFEAARDLDQMTKAVNNNKLHGYGLGPTFGYGWYCRWQPKLALPSPLPWVPAPVLAPTSTGTPLLEKPARSTWIMASLPSVMAQFCSKHSISRSHFGITGLSTNHKEEFWEVLLTTFGNDRAVLELYHDKVSPHGTQDHVEKVFENKDALTLCKMVGS